MSTPILATKLYVPPPRPSAVPRPRLVERLDEGLRRKLILISAPAGFGKTTLISEWVAGRQRPAAWLSLDERDNDPTRFLTYFVAALRTVAANVGEGVLGALGSPQPPPTESILTALLNEITIIEDDFVLVLDDYHVIDARAVDNALTFLLEHLPPRMHLLISGREDPHLPLARLRARGQLSELRATDLRFTSSEAAEFLNRVMGLRLSEEDIAALEAAMAAICRISASPGGASGWGGTVSDLAVSPMSLTRSSKPAGDKINSNLAGPESTVNEWGMSLGPKRNEPGCAFSV
jgi:LuxR family transcriptional regulator, maltose regulon positive regulatory protein